MIDLNETYSGHLMRDFTPPIQPPREINDPNDRKPPDLTTDNFETTASKYSNVWTEPETREHTNEDNRLNQHQADHQTQNTKGYETSSNRIEKKSNIESLLSNPAWRPRKISNPNYHKILNAFESLSPISAVGLELWSLNDQIHFDNFLIVDDERLAHQFALNSWALKHNLELYREPSVSLKLYYINVYLKA